MDHAVMHFQDVVCAQCGEGLTAEEAAWPDDAGDLLCDRCYCEAHHFPCVRCQGCGDVEDQHRYVAVFDSDAAGVALPGLYRVDRAPYYSQGLRDDAGGWLYAWVLTWCAWLPAWLDEPDGYPCGHLCLACQEQTLAEAEYFTQCASVALP